MTGRASFITSIESLQAFLLSGGTTIEKAIAHAYSANPWFIPEFSRQACEAMGREFLDSSKVEKWMAAYPHAAGHPKKVGIIMAGNVPLVGFHDLLCVLAAGHTAQIKLSDKDQYLLPMVTAAWTALAPDLSDRIQYADKLAGYDAVIATGSNNSVRYFEYYFRACPHILRQNRNGVAVLTGEESLDDLRDLAKDIFLFFGLGCRNVSKLFVPEGYDFARWEEAISDWKYLGDHHKYRNNLEYNHALYIINQTPHIQLGHLILKEDESIASRIGCVHYSHYQDRHGLTRSLLEHQNEIQCVISREPQQGWEHIGFGKGQQPALHQYADGVDTMQFLTSLYSA